MPRAYVVCPANPTRGVLTDCSFFLSSFKVSKHCRYMMSDELPPSTRILSTMVPSISAAITKESSCGVMTWERSVSSKHMGIVLSRLWYRRLPNMVLVLGCVEYVSRNAVVSPPAANSPVIVWMTLCFASRRCGERRRDESRRRERLRRSLEGLRCLFGLLPLCGGLRALPLLGEGGALPRLRCSTVSSTYSESFPCWIIFSMAFFRSLHELVSWPLTS